METIYLDYPWMKTSKVLHCIQQDVEVLHNDVWLALSKEVFVTADTNIEQVEIFNFDIEPQVRKVLWSGPLSVNTQTVLNSLQ